MKGNSKEGGKLQGRGEKEGGGMGGKMLKSGIEPASSAWETCAPLGYGFLVFFFCMEISIPLSFPHQGSCLQSFMKIC